MKKVLAIYVLLSFIGFGAAQSLEMQNADKPNNNDGPIYATEAWVMTPEGTLGPITVSAEYSNQQYTNITTIFNESGLMFGATSRDSNRDPNSDNKAINITNIYAGLGSVGQPNNEYFSVSPTEIGTGIDAENLNENLQNGAFIQYSSVEGIAQAEGVDVMDNDEFYLGDVTYTFSQPVDNPVIHISGLGANAITGENSLDAKYLFFSTELELTGSSAGYTLTRLSGTADLYGNNEIFFDVDNTNKKIVNRFGDVNEPRPDDNGTVDYEAGSGSVLIEGENISEVVFRVTVRAKSNARWTEEDMYVGDIYAVSWSLKDPVCVVEPASGTPEKTYVGISTLDRNVDTWLSDANNENLLGAYIVMESEDKPFVVSRNANPGPYNGETASTTDNIQNPVEGMVVWDTTKNCLSLYKVDTNGTGYWSCVNIGCNQ